MLLQYHCFIALIWFLCKIKYIFKNGFKDAIIIEKWCLCDCVIILLFLLVFFLVAFMMLQPFALLGMLLWISLNYLLIFSLKKRGITKFFKSQIDPSFLIFFPPVFSCTCDLRMFIIKKNLWGFSSLCSLWPYIFYLFTDRPQAQFYSVSSVGYSKVHSRGFLELLLHICFH